MKIKRLPAIKAVFDALGLSMSEPCLREMSFDLESLRFRGVDAAAFKAAGCSCSDLKAAGFKYSDLKAAGFDPKSLQSAGYCWLSLIKEFGYDAVASSGCDVSRILVRL